MEKCEICQSDVLAGSTCPRSIECPDCFAPPRSWCVRPSEHRAMTLHEARWEAAEAIDRTNGVFVGQLMFDEAGGKQ